MSARTAQAKTWAKTRHGPQVLPSIPHEVLQQIASMIDRPTAEALAITCKSLRDAGEMRIWERIELHHEHDSGYGSTRGQMSPVKQKISEDRVLQAFRSYPRRLGFVNELMVVPFNVYQNQQFEILDKLQHVLITLTVKEPLRPLDLASYSGSRQPITKIGVGARPTAVKSQYPPIFDFLSKWTEKVKIFDRLRDLRIAIGQDDDFRLVVELLKLMPVLKSLELQTWITQRKMPNVSLVDLLLLHLLIEVMHRPLINAIIAILRNAPNLKHLALDGEWTPSADDPVYGVIREHRGLEAISWSAPKRTPARHLFNGTIPSNLTTLVESRSDKGEDQEQVLHSVLRIPKAANLQKYVILQKLRPSVAHYATTGVRPYSEVDTDDDGIITVSTDATKHFLGSLKNAPNLTEIHFGHKYAGRCFPPSRDLRRHTHLDGGRETYEPWGWLKPTVCPQDWERLGWRGAIVRTFVNTDFLPASKAQPELVHIRLLSRAAAASYNTSYVCTARRWSDLVSYRGYSIPINVLAEVYDLAEIPLGFLEGPRNQVLPRQAWELMDRYIVGLRQPPYAGEMEHRRRVPNGDDLSDNSDWEDYGRTPHIWTEPQPKDCGCDSDCDCDDSYERESVETDYEDAYMNGTYDSEYQEWKAKRYGPKKGFVAYDD